MAQPSFVQRKTSINLGLSVFRMATTTSAVGKYLFLHSVGTCQKLKKAIFQVCTRVYMLKNVETTTRGVLKIFRPATFLKKEALAQVFSCKVCEIFKNSFFTQHPRATVSENYKNKIEEVYRPPFLSPVYSYVQ